MVAYAKQIQLWLTAFGLTACIVGVKLLLHNVIGFEPIEQTSLHNSLVSGAVFVIGFLLSATIADYKESERIPSEFAASIDDMYQDSKVLHKTYSGFEIDRLRRSLIEILASFRSGTRERRHAIRAQIADLQQSFSDMERAGVPPNFVTKLKQQASGLTRNLFRVNYIQRIHFIPSATILAWSIVTIVLGVLILTDFESFYAALLITGTICFILVYMLLLISVISYPFRDRGSTRDDVSLFLIREVRAYLESEGTTETAKAYGLKHGHSQ